MKKLLASIKTKIQLAFLTFILLATLTGILSYTIVDTILDHEALKRKIDEMASHFAEARKQEKDFILYGRKEVAFLENGTCESLQEFARAIHTSQQLIRQIKHSEGLPKEDALYTRIDALEAAVLLYDRQFWGLVNAYKIRGFRDHGMEGDMREVVHQLQNCESTQEQWFALMLRRHEKDFFIRHDPAYVQALHKRAKDFIAFVEDSRLPHMTAAYKEKTTAAIRNYRTHFDRIAALETKIGLTKNEGFIGALNKTAESTEPLLAHLQQLIHDRNQTLAENSTLLLLFSIGLMLACGLAFNFLLARKISNPIIQLSQVVAQASVGDSTTLRTLEGMQREDELGTLIVSIGQMFREINLKIEEISQKNLLLQTTALQEKERIWITEGVSLFDGIVVKHANDVHALADDFLRNLVAYTAARLPFCYRKLIRMAIPL
ncbi:HAMP domain-containing protein [Cesiribacter andamanensis]|uniref:Signal transduction histidine kinase involved in nitrogen fixation and metabolism regulation n=1 Tax=Cesiribacter andamanensis AMV16 TaxID=1279009 RepID=M7N6C6_9BACT|nr:HAMP domain-containing protein [Cesiribacter andamanensis]EMR02766.1 Signal transduction histidine kinase involved in nitrogen fixation and metabolism regulation [Cesiribacter andamanensis AMV16]